MSIIFEPEFHKYTSLDESDVTKWISVTGVVSNFKQPFDGKAISKKSSSKKDSKWYGYTPEQIQEIWNKETERAQNLGNWYHKQRESDLLNFSVITRHGVELPIIHPIEDATGKKIASSQKLENGVYPEHMVYIKTAGICGQSDLVEIANNKVYITDYKTNKEIKTKSYVNWEGKSQKMLPPLSHLDDCNYNHYSLQLSLYMYMILKHNPQYSPGDLVINHIIFEEEDEKDVYGYPINKINSETGDYIVKEIVTYKLPYLKNEVLAMLKWLDNNRHKITKK